MSKTKRCPRCGETKPVDDFCVDRNRPGGRACWCRGCEKLRGARYYRDNKAKVAARQKEYRQRRGNERQRERYRTDPECRERKHALSKAYYRANRERLLAAHAVYNPTPAAKAARAKRQAARYQIPAVKAARAKTMAAYNKTPAGRASKARANNKRRTRIANTENTLTAAEWQDILDEQGSRCAMCGREFTNDDPPTRDHIIPVVRGGGLTRENVQALHRSCNTRKGSK